MIQEYLGHILAPGETSYDFNAKIPQIEFVTCRSTDMVKLISPFLNVSKYLLYSIAGKTIESISKKDFDCNHFLN